MPLAREIPLPVWRNGRTSIRRCKTTASAPASTITPNTRSTIGLDADWQGGRLTGSGYANALLNQPAGRTTSATQQDVVLRETFSNYTAFYKRELDSLHSNLLVSTNYATLHNTQQQDFNQLLRGPRRLNGAAQPLSQLYPGRILHFNQCGRLHESIWPHGPL